MSKFLTSVVLLSLLFVCGCARFAADASRGATFHPVRISAAEVDAAEPVTATAPDGGFYVAWVNHNANSESDVMLARFDQDGAASGAAVRVNQMEGVATAWRGDQPSVAVTDRSRPGLHRAAESPPPHFAGSLSFAPPDSPD